MIGEMDYDDLLADLYGGLSQPERTRRFLSKLGSATGGHVGALLWQDFACTTGGGLIAVGVDAPEMARYEAEFAGENLWFARTSQRTQVGSVFFSDDWVSLPELHATRWYNDYLRQLEIVHSVGVCGQLHCDRAVFLTVCRSKRSGAFEAPVRRFMQRIAPHFVNVQSLRVQLDRLRAQPEPVEAPHQRAMFVLDRRFRCIECNPAAELQIAAGWWRGRVGTLLEPAHPISRAAWASAVRGLGANGPFRIVPVHDANECLVAFARLHRYRNDDGGYGDGAACYALLVRPLHLVGDADLAAPLKMLFGLTAAEVQLALALHRHGDLANAASALKIALSSARTRLQSVFEKTATHRQAELLRIVDTLADTIA